MQPHSSIHPRFDPVLVEVWRHLLESIAEEMGAALERTGYSPNIKERRDHSCALFDAEGRLLAQAAHIPVHLGAMPLMMERLFQSVHWHPGVMWLCNDPMHGGTHLPDLTLVAPVFLADGQTQKSKSRSRLIGFVANRAHHADIGGLAPGSLSVSTDIYQEGILIPPVRLVVGGRMQPDVLRLVVSNSRTPDERKGDLAAQVASNRVGMRRLQELISRAGLPEFERRTAEAQVYAESVVRSALAKAADGEYRFTDYLDDDGHGSGRLPITVLVRLSGGSITFDFTGTAPQTRGPINATEAVTRSACFYVVRCLVQEELPTNGASFTPVEVIAPEGTIVNARFPAAVAAGNVETSQRIVDTLLGALAQAFPELVPAASQGTMNNLTIGGWDPFRERAYAYYETICGGAGASSSSAGTSAVHTHMTNTRNTPIEALEMHYPLRVREYRIREGSGGQGQNEGGDGVVRAVELLADAQISLMTDRRDNAPYGLEGGGPGSRGRNTFVPAGGDERVLASKASLCGSTGDVIVVDTPGGGGWGSASKREAKE
jgi:N-methylhydantoinase B